jgi:hypothetical protein
MTYGRCGPVHGASRTRTGALLVANQTLSQLSYGPKATGWYGRLAKTRAGYSDIRIPGSRMNASYLTVPAWGESQMKRSPSVG